MMMELSIPEIDENGVVTGQEKLWECFERVVEDSPNRTGDGNFVWPRIQMPNGDYFGFDTRELAIKKANLSIDGDIQGFFSQYYNDPNTSALHRIGKNHFKYIDPRHLRFMDNGWYYSGKKLKLICAMDLAFSKSGIKRRDYTAIVVVGMDHEGFVYILDLDRFQTDKLEVYYERFLELLRKWSFKVAVVETNNGGGLVAEYMQDTVRKEGGSVEIQGKAASNQQSKVQRIIQALEPRYRNGEVFHSRGGLTAALEEELILPRPSNDDLKDAVALAVQELKRPLGSGLRKVVASARLITENISRFGGSRRRA
jgi:phage terminase large subunit-like protein